MVQMESVNVEKGMDGKMSLIKVLVFHVINNILDAVIVILIMMNAIGVLVRTMLSELIYKDVSQS